MCHHCTSDECYIHQVSELHLVSASAHAFTSLDVLLCYLVRHPVNRKHTVQSVCCYTKRSAIMIPAFHIPFFTSFVRLTMLSGWFLNLAFNSDGLIKTQYSASEERERSTRYSTHCTFFFFGSLRPQRLCICMKYISQIRNLRIQIHSASELIEVPY